MMFSHNSLGEFAPGRRHAMPMMEELLVSMSICYRGYQRLENRSCSLVVVTGRGDWYRYGNIAITMSDATCSCKYQGVSSWFDSHPWGKGFIGSFIANVDHLFISASSIHRLRQLDSPLLRHSMFRLVTGPIIRWA